MKNLKDKTVAHTANVQSNGHEEPGDHLSILKTYKLYIGGKFPRTESGRFFKLKDADGKTLANICRGSRKDFRMAVVAARGAQNGWAERSAYNRGQILYRIAEMLEGRKGQFFEELQSVGYAYSEAKSEVQAAIDRIVYYAGWADKYQQVFSAVNPVASSHFNFSVLEPMGVIATFSSENSGFLGLISAIMPAIVGGNTVIVLASTHQPHCAISFAEVLHTSDLPGGVVNILTGYRAELIGHFSTHKDVNALNLFSENEKEIKTATQNSIENLKRIRTYSDSEWNSEKGQNPYFIKDLQEVKTTWHPVGV